MLRKMLATDGAPCCRSIDANGVRVAQGHWSCARSRGLQSHGQRRQFPRPWALIHDDEHKRAFFFPMRFGARCKPVSRCQTSAVSQFLDRFPHSQPRFSTFGPSPATIDPRVLTLRCERLDRTPRRRIRTAHVLNVGLRRM